MEYNLYCVKDVVSNRFFPPFAQSSDALAERNFKEYLMFDETAKHHPEDMQLWRVGTFNNTTGEITSAGLQAEMLVAGQKGE